MNDPNLGKHVCKDDHRALLAQSAALLGKAKKLSSLAEDNAIDEFFRGADAFVDIRDDLLSKVNAVIAKLNGHVDSAEAVSGMTSSVLPADALDKSKLISLSQRLGVHQSTRQSRPTKKTKQQKPQKFAHS